jgi:hypothetical protein
VFASSVSVFLPCPFSDFSSYPRHFGGRGICGTVSELRDGVEHKFSDLPRDEVCLVFGSYFLRFLSAGKCWIEEDHSHSCSAHRPSSISAQSRRTRVCCCYRAGLLGRGPVGWEWYVDLGSTALGFICLGSCAATELGNSGMSLTWFPRRVKWQTCHSPKDVATKLSNREAMSSSWSPPSHVRYSGKKKPWVGSQAGLSLLPRQL